MEYKGKWNDVDVYDDYAHHPTEITVTLQGFRDMGFGRIFCIYQPHTYSRTEALWDDFTSALSTADRVLLVDIYAARETDTLGMSPEVMAGRIGKNAISCPKIEDAASLVVREVEDGDTLIIMGAGNIDKIFGMLKNDIKDVK
jgi:UDP-N-acetylmuramate--alanine ligase